MKRKFFIVFILIFSLNSLFGQVYDKGLELSNKLFARSESTEFIEMFTPKSSDLFSYYKSIKGKISKSDFVNCYEIIWDFEDLFMIFLNENVSDSSEVVTDYFNQSQLFTLYISMINNENGENVAALSAILNCNSLFDDDKLNETKNYIYIFKKSYPVVVSFKKGDDNAVLANAFFLFDDRLINGSDKDIKKVLDYPFDNIIIKKIK